MSAQDVELKEGQLELESGEIVEVSAEWYAVMDSSLHYLRYHEARLTMLKQSVKIQQARIQAKIDFHKGNLNVAAGFARRTLGADMEVPNGKVTTRVGKGTFKITDKKAALAFCKANEIPFKTTEEAQTTPLRPFFKENDDGSLALKDGTIVEFASVEGKGRLSVNYTLRDAPHE